MPRPATGSIIERRGRDGRTYRSLRFRAYGKRYTEPLGPVSRAKAERALAHTIADIERGIWTPPVAAAPVPTFEEFAEEWWTLHEARLAHGTRADYRGRLDRYLIPAFGHLPLDAITYDIVERYLAARLAEDDPLSPRTINMSLTLMAAILERAVERDLIARNPAKGKARRAPERAPVRSYLETAEQICALLDAAGELDREAPESRSHVERRAMLATLTFAGLRISELLALRWRDVDLAGGWLSVEESKTDAGIRKVKIREAAQPSTPAAFKADCPAEELPPGFDQAQWERETAEAEHETPAEEREAEERLWQYIATAPAKTPQEEAANEARLNAEIAAANCS